MGGGALVARRAFRNRFAFVGSRRTWRTWRTVGSLPPRAAVCVSRIARGGGFALGGCGRPGGGTPHVARG
eukprot:1293238-Prymnesium_polylepis.1